MAKEIKTNAMRILDRENVSYEMHIYKCDEFIDGSTVADMLGQDHNITFKTLVAVGKSGGHYVFVIPVDDELDLKKCASSVGEKSVELIHVKNLTSITGYIRGGCSPIGMKKQFPTVIHESATGYDKISISGGRVGTQIMINPFDLAKVANAAFHNIIMQ